MSPAAEILLALLAASALLFFNRLIFTRLLLPGQEGILPVFAVIHVSGDGDGLEQTLRHLHWLQTEKLSQFTVVVVGRELTPTGQKTVQALIQKDAALLFYPEEATTRILK